jgi:hypothetical protein
MTENAALHPEIRVRFRPWFLLADAVLRLGVLLAMRERLMQPGTSWFLQL